MIIPENDPERNGVVPEEGESPPVGDVADTETPPEPEPLTGSWWTPLQRDLAAQEAPHIFAALESLDEAVEDPNHRELIQDFLDYLHQRLHPTPSLSGEDYLYSDAYNALQLVLHHGHEMRYCTSWKTWLTWADTHWARDTTGLLMRWQRQVINDLRLSMGSLEQEEITALLGHIKRSLNTPRLKAAVEQAQSWETISIDQAVLDSDPWLLNCTNGTVDLRTGTLGPHAHTDMLTKCLPVAYDPAAVCPTWDAFLWRIMGGSQGADDPDTMGSGELENRRMADTQAQELTDFLQRAIGYTLTGSTREQVLFILHGPTKTGKSTFLATIRALLGPYGQQADMESFMHKDRQEVRNDIADLAGARFVCALEGQEGRRLAESLVKQMTGGSDLLKARFLYAEHFTFKPQFKLFLGTNHKPRITDPDGAIWERIRLIPFVVQIPPDEREKDLEERLQTELPGILAWAMRGALAWQQMGELQEPDAVLAFTADYREEMDDVGRFLQEVCLTEHAYYKTKASVLLMAYHQWAGHTHMSAKALASRLIDKDYVAKRETTGMFWQGIGLPSDVGE